MIYQNPLWNKVIRLSLGYLVLLDKGKDDKAAKMLKRLNELKEQWSEWGDGRQY